VGRAKFVLIVILTLFAGTVFGAAPDGPLTFQDAAGRTIRLEKPPERILAIGHGPQIIAHLMFMFPESRSRFIGWERRGRIASEFIPLIDPDFDKRYFTDPNTGVEEVAASHPDLVLIRGFVTDPKGDALEKVGIPVAYLGLENPEQYRKDIELAGLILGNPGRAAEINRFFQERLDRIERALAGLEDARKPSVFLAMTMSRGGKIAVRAPAPSWIQTVMVRLAGGRPVWAEGMADTSSWSVVNIEQIARWDPDGIILVVWHTLDPQKTLAALKTDETWRALRAVQGDEMRAFPADLYGWDTPDPRWILGLTWLARTFHPDRFPGLDMKAEIVSFYRDLYGLSPDDVEAKILPSIRTGY